jgi:hypothetical protein
MPHACPPPSAYQLAPSIFSAPGCCPAHAAHHNVTGAPCSPKLAAQRQPAAGWSARLQPWAQSAQLATGGVHGAVIQTSPVACHWRVSTHSILRGVQMTVPPMAGARVPSSPKDLPRSRQSLGPYLPGARAPSATHAFAARGAAPRSRPE